MRRSITWSALLAAAMACGCYGTSSAEPDVPLADAGVSFETTDAADDVDAPRLVVEPAIEISYVEPSGDCAEWEEPTHPSPIVPEGAEEMPRLLWTYRNDDEPYVGLAHLASDGSLRVLGPRARSFVRLERDGSIAWQVDPGGYGYIAAVAPDGSLFVAPGDEEGRHPSVVQIDSGGRIVFERTFGASSYGTGAITVGPRGRVYLTHDGTVIATCRGVPVWSLTARSVSGAARDLAVSAVDAEGAVLVATSGVGRILRVSPDGREQEWLGSPWTLPVTGDQPVIAGARAVHGTRALVWASHIDRVSSSFAVPGEAPVPAPGVIALDGLGRSVVWGIDDSRSESWLWEQDDGSFATLAEPCGAMVMTDDGGAVCGGPYNDVLRRVDGATRIAWELPLVEGTVTTMVLDLDGRLIVTEERGPLGDGAVRVFQTRLRPPRGYWQDVGRGTGWARP